MFAWLLTVVFGIGVLMGIYKKRFLKFPWIMTALLLAFIGSLILLYMYYARPYEERIFYKFLAFIVGELMFMVGIHNIYAFFKCKTEIPATYLRYNTYYGGRGITSQAPVFEYTYKGQKYIGQSAHTESYKYLNQDMKIGSTYVIYINPQNPNVFILRKKVGFINVMILALGLFFLFAFLFI